jgi:hypothetical protein
MRLTAAGGIMDVVVADLSEEERGLA